MYIQNKFVFYSSGFFLLTALASVIPLSMFEVIRHDLPYATIALILLLFCLVYPYMNEERKMSLNTTIYVILAGIFDCVAFGGLALAHKNSAVNPTLILGLATSAIMLMVGAREKRPAQFKDARSG